MDTIGNNIANVNTVGFKRGQVTFQEVFSQVTKGASAPSGGKGGTNPQQVGMGVAIGSINTIHTVGPGQRTDNPTDLMIDGEGFFVVSDDSNFNNKFYTRAGNFTLDRDGSLVTADGFKVLGYMADENGNISSDVSGIRINKSDTSAPTATENIIFKGNLNANTEITADDKEGELIDTVVTDSLGNSYKITFEMRRIADTGGNQSWEMAVKRVTDQGTGRYLENADGTPINDILIGDGVNDNKITLQFNDKGKLVSTPALSSLNLNEIEFNYYKDKTEVDTADRVGPSGSFEQIKLFDPSNPESYKNIHQYANDADFKPYAHGNTSGTLEGFTIDPTGTVTGVFTNGERRALGQIMLAKFDNPMGLQKMGSNFFLDTRNSGEAQFGTGGSSGFGAVNGGTLEMSNVDISLEFTEMITTQRGFQANSRIITTSDEMLQELVNLKR
jgi:flagellar hook protein FlgE